MPDGLLRLVVVLARNTDFFFLPAPCIGEFPGARDFGMGDAALWLGNAPCLGSIISSLVRLTNETSSSDSLRLEFDDILDAKPWKARTLCGSSLNWVRPAGGDCNLADLESDPDTGSDFFKIGGSRVGALLLSDDCEAKGL